MVGELYQAEYLGSMLLERGPIVFPESGESGSSLAREESEPGPEGDIDTAPGIRLTTVSSPVLEGCPQMQKGGWCIPIVSIRHLIKLLDEVLDISFSVKLGCLEVRPVCTLPGLNNHPFNKPGKAIHWV